MNKRKQENILYWGVLVVFWLLIMWILLGCSDVTGPSCTDRVVVQDVLYSHPAYEIQQGLIDHYKSIGWKCKGAVIRNAFGNRVGTEYTCTICE